MFETVGRKAEELAAGVGESRRVFLAGLGRAALAAAGVLGGLLVPGAVRANGVELCFYKCPDGATCKKKVAFSSNCGRCPAKLTCGSNTCHFWYCTVPD